MGRVLRLNSLLSRSMMLVVLKEIHSSGGKSKKVKQESMLRFRHSTAEGMIFCHFWQKVLKHSHAFSRDGA